MREGSSQQELCLLTLALQAHSLKNHKTLLLGPR